MISQDIAHSHRQSKQHPIFERQDSSHVTAKGQMPLFFTLKTSRSVLCVPSFEPRFHFELENGKDSTPVFLL
jgi:hypothetical protein